MELTLQKFEANGKMFTIVYVNEENTKIGIKTEFVKNTIFEAWKDLQIQFQNMIKNESVVLCGFTISQKKGISFITQNSLSGVFFQKSKTEYKKKGEKEFEEFFEHLKVSFCMLLEGSFQYLLQSKQTKLQL